MSDSVPLIKKPFITFNDILFIFLASVLYALGVGLLLTPAGIAPGGVYGSAIIINYITADFQTNPLLQTLLSVSFITIIINIPILIVGVWKLKLKFLITTFIAIFLQNSFVFIIEILMKNGVLKQFPITNDPMLAGIVGGALVGVCIGIIFRAGATCGGSDVIVKLMRLRFRYMKTGVVFLIIDGSIVALSAIALGTERALFAAVALFVQSMVLNFVLYGSDSARLVYIISDKAQDLSGPILKMIIGITYLNGEGAYNHSSKKIIMCVVRKRQLPAVRSVVKDVDPDAFMIVTNANQVLGRGFKNIKEEDL